MEKLPCHSKLLLVVLPVVVKVLLRFKLSKFDFFLVMFTNPLEIVKIRMQLDKSATLAGTCREVGIRKLYTGILLE